MRRKFSRFVLWTVLGLSTTGLGCRSTSSLSMPSWMSWGSKAPPPATAAAPARPSTQLPPSPSATMGGANAYAANGKGSSPTASYPGSGYPGSGYPGTNSANAASSRGYGAQQASTSPGYHTGPYNTGSQAGAGAPGAASPAYGATTTSSPGYGAANYGSPGYGSAGQSAPSYGAPNSGAAGAGGMGGSGYPSTQPPTAGYPQTSNTGGYPGATMPAGQTSSPYPAAGVEYANADNTGGGSGEPGPQTGGYPRSYPTTDALGGSTPSTSYVNPASTYASGSTPTSPETGYRPGSTGRSVTAAGVLGTPSNVQAGYQAPTAGEEPVPEYDPMANPENSAPPSGGGSFGGNSFIPPSGM